MTIIKSPELWVPHNYQLTAISFLIKNIFSGLFLDPGLGKTSISLATIKILKNANKVNGVLMFAPLRPLYSTWPAEIKKWSNFNNLTYSILHEENKPSIWGPSKDIYLINPEGLPWLYYELLKGLKSGKKCPFDTLWIDESTKFKNHETKARFQLIKDMLPLFRRRHIMTGTPAPKNLLDLWSQMYIIDQGKTLGCNYYDYRSKYFQTNDWNKYDWELKDFCEDEIHKKVAPLVLEMSSDDYLKLPPILYNDIKVTLPKKAFKYYKQMEKEFFITLDDMEASADQRVQAQGKCHQIANGNVYEDIPEGLDEDEIREFKKTRKVIHIHKAKIEALTDLIEELNGKPLMVAYKYKHDLKALKEAFGDDIPVIGSRVSKKKAKYYEDQWNLGKIPLLFVQPKSMAHGLNMQKGGHDICWYSLIWELEDYIQLNDRIYRQGVKNTVRIHHLVGDKTIDEAMLIRLDIRNKRQKNLREAIKYYRKNAA